MSKLPIFIDMDEVICNFLEKLCFEYNNRLNKNIKVSDIKQWNLKPYIGEEGMILFQEPNFFTSLTPIEGAIETIKLLQDEVNEIFIITSPTNEHSVIEKYQWVKKNLPFFPIRNLILVGNKGDLLSKINEGILFDDCPEYLEKFKGVTVAMNRLYNQNTKVNFRVNTWKEFNQIINIINKERSICTR